MELRKSLAGSQEKWFQFGESDYHESDVIIARRLFGLDEYRAKYYLQWTWENQKRVALSHILNQNNVKICDVGCGIGTFHKYFFLNGKNNSLTGVDIAPTGLAIATKINNDLNCKYIEGNAYDIPLPSSEFDDVFSLQLYQSLDEPAKLLREMKRIVKSGGTITVTTTNFYHDLLWSPTSLTSFIYNRNYPQNSEKRIKEVLASLGLKAKIEYITFRPRQSNLKFINRRIFQYVMSCCITIEKLLHLFRLHRLCSIIVIRIGEQVINRHKENLKKLQWLKVPFAILVFCGLLTMHWGIDIYKCICRKLT